MAGYGKAESVIAIVAKISNEKTPLHSPLTPTLSISSICICKQLQLYVMMPPHTTGFHYTPPSYLLRAKDTTNRPWHNKNEDGDNSGENGSENEYDLPQEDRPQTRRESHLDAHFQQRVRTKQSRYRAVLKGEAEIPDSSTTSSSVSNHDDAGENDSVLLAAAKADSYGEDAVRKKPEPVVTRRTSSSTTLSSEAETVRSLRAQRLRASLLKQTPDEFDVRAKLERRRMARKEEEATARRAERDSHSYRSGHQSLSKGEQRRSHEKEWTALEAEREALAHAKEEANIALVRAAEINEERRRQRELNATLEADRLEERKWQKSKRDKMSAKSRSKSGNADDKTSASDSDADNGFFFLNELGNGLLQTCVSGCFCDDSLVLMDYKKEVPKSMKGLRGSCSSATPPDLVSSSDSSGGNADDDDTHYNSVLKSRVYAKYRA